MDWIQVVLGDITALEVEAIVNSSDPKLSIGTGVSSAIHHAAGRDLFAECQKLSGCNVGEAKITRGFKLPARWIIHTVGPKWQGGDHGEGEALAACYRNIMSLAHRYTIKSLAFPSISTGEGGFPVERACVIALHEIKQALRLYEEDQKIYIACYDEKTLRSYNKAWRDTTRGPIT